MRVATSSDPARPVECRATLTHAPIGWREKRFSPSKLVALVSVLAESGTPADRVLDGTGLDTSDLANPFTLTSSHQFLTAARHAVRLHPGLALGLRMGERLRASSYGMYGYALLCAESMRQAFDTAVQFHQLANPTMPITWTECDGQASWLFPRLEDLPWLEGDEALYRFLLELQFVIHVTFIKDVMGAWCVPARADLIVPVPAHAAELATMLSCVPTFGQAINRLSYPAVWLVRAPQLANPITAAQVSEHCAKLLEDCAGPTGIARRVVQELTRSPGRFPDIEDVAGRLCMTSRTLRRKLEAEGTSYSALLVSVRKALALDYLGTTSLSTEGIASTLGFSDAVGFRHAFKRWTGMTPSEYRRSPRAGAVRPSRAPAAPG